MLVPVLANAVLLPVLANEVLVPVLATSRPTLLLREFFVGFKKHTCTLYLYLYVPL